MGTLRNTPRFAFLRFADPRQRMHEAHLAQVRSVQNAIPLAPTTGNRLGWPEVSPEHLTIARLFVSSSRELARTARGFRSAASARKQVAAMVASHGELTGSIVSDNGRWGWYLALLDTPVLVSCVWFTDAAEAQAELDLAQTVIGIAQPSPLSTRLPADTAGPLAIPRSAPQFSPTTRSLRGESEMPAPMRLGTGTTG